MALDKNKLIEALNEGDPGTQWFLDAKTKTVRKVSLSDPRGIEQFKRDIAGDAQRFVKIPKRTSEERYTELEGFIRQISDKALQAKLSEALSSPSPYREFRLLMERRSKEQRQFENYLNACAQKRLQDFLKTTSIR